MTILAIIWRDPVLRLLGLVSLLFGAIVSTIGPHLSLLGITVFGLSDTVYAAMLTGSLLVSVAAAVGIGVVTDQRRSRRPMALFAAVTIVMAPVLVWLAPGQASFVVAHVLLFPVSASIFGQVFAVARLYAMSWPVATRDGTTSVIRAIFAVPFVLVLPAWGLAFDAGLPLVAIYPVLSVLGAAFLWLVWRDWPADATAPWEERPSGLSFVASLREVAAGPVAWRVLWMGFVHCGSTLLNVLLALLFIEVAGRNTGSVGLFFGGFVLLEILVMMNVGRLSHRVRRLHLIAAGAVLYAVFMALLPVLAGHPSVWLLMLPAAVGGGLLYGLSISYLQDLLDARPGVGASLPALQRLVSEGLAAGIFAVGATLAGYGLAAFIGAGAILVGAAMLLFLDRRATGG